MIGIKTRKAFSLFAVFGCFSCFNIAKLFMMHFNKIQFFGSTASTFHSHVHLEQFCCLHCAEYPMALQPCRWSKRRMATFWSSLFLGEDRLHLTAADQIWLTKINGRALKSDQFNLATVLGRNTEGRLSTRLSSLQFSLNVNLVSGWRKAEKKTK